MGDQQAKARAASLGPRCWKPALGLDDRRYSQSKWEVMSPRIQQHEHLLTWSQVPKIPWLKMPPGPIYLLSVPSPLTHG